MATMNISLPDVLKDWVEEQASSGRYASASDYVRDVIRRDQERDQVFAELRRLGEEALARGSVERTREEILQRVRAKASQARRAV